jgi:hypothetical protein
MKEFPQNLKKQFQAPNMIRELRSQMLMPKPPSKKLIQMALKPFQLSKRAGGPSH